MCTVHCVLCPLSIHVKYRRFSLQGTGEGLGQTFNAVVSGLDRREGAMHRLVVQRLRVPDLGFRVQGSEFRVEGEGLRVQGSGFRVQGSGFRGTRGLCKCLLSAFARS